MTANRPRFSPFRPLIRLACWLLTESFFPLELQAGSMGCRSRSRSFFSRVGEEDQITERSHPDAGSSVKADPFVPIQPLSLVDARERPPRSRSVVDVAGIPPPRAVCIVMFGPWDVFPLLRRLHLSSFVGVVVVVASFVAAAPPFFRELHVGRGHAGCR